MDCVKPGTTARAARIVASLGAALMLSAACACSPAVRLKSVDDIDAASPPALATANGTLSEKRSHQILTAMARQAGVSEVLLHHLAVEEAYTDSPLVMGNRALLLRDGPATYDAMSKAIASANHHVNLEVYTFQDDEVGQRMADLLIERARAGVDVNVIYDSVGCIGTSAEFFEELKNQGLKLVEFNPIDPTRAKGDWRVEHRDHRKLVIVDNRIAFTGGINISTEYSGTLPSLPFRRGKSSERSKKVEPPWRDTHVQIEGPVVGEFQKLFRRTWEKQHGQALPWDRYFEPAGAAGNEIVRAVGSTPDDETNVMHTTLLSAITRAERSIHLTQAYFAPDDELEDAIKAAGKRGIDVQMILPSGGFWAILYAGRSYYSELLDAGVKVYEREGQLLHAKTAIIDGVWSTVGSTNLDYRSLVKNDEINAVILGEEFAGELEAMFQEDLAHSREITREEWSRRGPGTRVKEILGRAWENWL